MFLIFVNELGPNYKKENIYEFIFSSKVDENKKNSVTDSVLTHLNYETTTVDQLQQLTGLTIDELLTRLLDLELSGQVIRVLDGYTRIGRL